MEYDFQRASMLKRVPAWLLDIILFIVLTTGFLALWSMVFNVDAKTAELSGIITQYEQQFGGTLEIPFEEQEKMTEEQLQAAQALSKQINDALSQDEKAVGLLQLIVGSIISMISLSALMAYLVLEFLIPLLFKNGQTLGKKCFGVALMRKDGVRVTPFIVFTRTVLGKCVVETLIPAMLLIGTFFGFVGIIGLVLLLVMLLAQVIVPLVTRNKTGLHDLIACTVAVDMSSQMIFDSVEAMEAYNASIKESAASERE